jgi:hypothetical protein
VLFHLRLTHRATQPLKLSAGREKNKLAVFLICSRNSAHAEKYHQFIYSRPDYIYLKDFSYDRQLLETAKQAGVRLI